MNFKLVFFVCLFPFLSSAQHIECHQIDTLFVDSNFCVTINQETFYAKIKADSSLENYVLSLPCSSWSIVLDTLNCNKKYPGIFNAKGAFILTAEHYEKGLCFCESCSRSARTVINSEKSIFIEGQNCNGTLTVLTQIKTDPSKPDWFNKKLNVGDKIKLNRLLFYPNKSMFVKSSLEELALLFELMKKNKKLNVQIQGHVNGPKQKNLPQFQTLSENRAKAVYQYLIKRGIRESRLEYKGYGNTMMLFKKPKNESEMKQNRRVEVLIK